MVKLKSDKEFIKNELATIDIGENSQEEFEKMFFEFISARKNDYNEKVPSKGMLGIKRALNVLTKSKENGYDPFRVLKHSLNKGWRGLFYTNDSLINAPVSYNEVVMEDYKKVVAVLQQGGTPTIENTAVYQINKLKRVAELQAKDDAEKVYKDKKEKENTEKLTANLRVFNACMKFSNKTINDKNLFMNILDKGIGERSYLYLMEYYRDTMSKKYRSERERVENFEMLYKFLPDYLRDNFFNYYPLILVHYIMRVNIQLENDDVITSNNFLELFRDNKKNNDVIDTHIFDIMNNHTWYGFEDYNQYGKIWNEFIKYYTSKRLNKNPMFVVKYFANTELKKIDDTTALLDSRGSFSKDDLETISMIFTDWSQENIDKKMKVSFKCECYE